MIQPAEESIATKQGAIPIELLTVAAMRQLEGLAIDSGRVSACDLMEKAGLQVVAAIKRFIFEKSTSHHRRAIVLCGPGHNGGDGFVIARHLRAEGWKVSVFELRDRAGSYPPTTAKMRELYGQDNQCEPIERFLKNQRIDDQTIIVDALFGSGLNRPIDGVAAAALAKAMAKGQLIAVDILSGVNADTGRFDVQGLNDLSSKQVGPAQITVTFEQPKPGHIIGVGGYLSGRLVVASIGLGSVIRELDLPVIRPRILSRELMAQERLQKYLHQHKYNHGHVMCFAGGRGRGGAARLAARAALRVGAGLVTIAAPKEAMAEHAARLDAVMLREANNPQEIRHLLGDQRINSFCIGPGLGDDDVARSKVLAVLEAGKKTVLDADALTAFSDHPEALFGGLGKHTVLTPHGGEFARLFPDLAHAMGELRAMSPMDAVQRAAHRANSVLLLKGATTIVASPEGEVWLGVATGRQAAPWLATAGSGDVLAGLIAGLLARGFATGQAACHGIQLHVAAARKFGAGLIAEDLPDMLPIALSALFANNEMTETRSTEHDDLYELSSRLW